MGQLRLQIEKLDKLEYEIYPLVLALVMFLKILTTSITGGIARYVTEAYAKGEKDRVTEIVSSMVPAAAVASLGFLALGGVAAWNIGMVFNIDPRFLDGARIMVAMLVLSRLALSLLAVPALLPLSDADRGSIRTRIAHRRRLLLLLLHQKREHSV